MATHDSAPARDGLAEAVELIEAARDNLGLSIRETTRTVGKSDGWWRNLVDAVRTGRPTRQQPVLIVGMAEQVGVQVKVCELLDIGPHHPLAHTLATPADRSAGVLELVRDYLNRSDLNAEDRVQIALDLINTHLEARAADPQLKMHRGLLGTALQQTSIFAGDGGGKSEAHLHTADLLRSAE